MNYRGSPLDDTELIAVLTAAVAAETGRVPDGLRVVSYRLANAQNPAWNAAGRNDVMSSRQLVRPR